MKLIKINQTLTRFNVLSVIVKEIDWLNQSNKGSCSPSSRPSPSLHQWKTLKWQFSNRLKKRYFKNKHAVCPSILKKNTGSHDVIQDVVSLVYSAWLLVYFPHLGPRLGLFPNKNSFIHPSWKWSWYRTKPDLVLQQSGSWTLCLLPWAPLYNAMN